MHAGRPNSAAGTSLHGSGRDGPRVAVALPPLHLELRVHRDQLGGAAPHVASRSKRSAQVVKHNPAESSQRASRPSHSAQQSRRNHPEQVTVNPVALINNQLGVVGAGDCVAKEQLVDQPGPREPGEEAIEIPRVVQEIDTGAEVRIPIADSRQSAVP